MSRRVHGEDFRRLCDIHQLTIGYGMALALLGTEDYGPWRNVRQARAQTSADVRAAMADCRDCAVKAARRGHPSTQSTRRIHESETP